MEDDLIWLSSGLGNCTKVCCFLSEILKFEPVWDAKSIAFKFVDLWIPTRFCWKQQKLILIFCNHTQPSSTLLWHFMIYSLYAVKFSLKFSFFFFGCKICRKRCFFLFFYVIETCLNRSKEKQQKRISHNIRTMAFGKIAILSQKCHNTETGERRYPAVMMLCVYILGV